MSSAFSNFGGFICCESSSATSTCYRVHDNETQMTGHVECQHGVSHKRQAKRRSCTRANRKHGIRHYCCGSLHCKTRADFLPSHPTIGKPACSLSLILSRQTRSPRSHQAPNTISSSRIQTLRLRVPSLYEGTFLDHRP